LIKGHEVSGVAFKANAFGVDPSTLSSIFNAGLGANGQRQTLYLNQQA
jgi:hypothetical protein